MKRIYLFIYICMWLTTASYAQEVKDSLTQMADEAVVDSGRVAYKQPRWMRAKSVDSRLEKIHKKLNPIDTTYIEPQRFNFTVMLQNTNTYEVYRLNTSEGQSITFAPEPSIKIGPYFGWRWAFLGYTIDVRHLDLTHRDWTKTEYDVSLYSSMVGIDIYYRKTGNDYRIRRVTLGKGIDTEPMKNVSFGGLTSSIKGADIYYIINYRKFSYPAAFSQSTVQRRSAGSPLVGVGYTEHSLAVDWEAFGDLVDKTLGQPVAESVVDESLMFRTVKYRDISISGGYAYNWVFARNWLMAASLSLAMAYKHTSGDLKGDRFRLHDFTISNINVDGIGRFGLVWNNTRWYAGMNAILHAYNYRKSRFYTNNMFGSLNVYFGLNFGRRKN